MLSIIALAFLSHLIFQWFGWSRTAAIDAEVAVVVGLVLVLVPVALGLVYFGVSRIPARARVRRLKQQHPSAIVLDADMDDAFRNWIGTRAEPAIASPVKVSRFGAALAADNEGLAVWAGTGETPLRAVSVPWSEIAEILPPDAKDFIGADSPQTVMTMRFASLEPDLRVLLFVSSPLVNTGEFKDIVQVVNALEELRRRSATDGNGS